MANMEMKLKEEMLEKLIIAENPLQLVEELIDGQIMEVNKITPFIFKHIAQVQNEIMMQYLAQIIPQICCRQKSLTDVHHQFESFDDNESIASKQAFLRKVLIKIGKR
jgi:hypothetical protein